MRRIIMVAPRILKSHARRMELTALSNATLADRLFESAWLALPIFSEASDVVQEAMRRLNPQVYDEPADSPARDRKLEPENVEPITYSARSSHNAPADELAFLVGRMGKLMERYRAHVLVDTSVNYRVEEPG